MNVLLGPEIKIPNYTNAQREIWVDENCPAYTGIMAAVNGVSWKLYGCFVDQLTDAERAIVDKQAANIGPAWIEMPGWEEKGGDVESIEELVVNAGNAAWKVWQALPEPKLNYVEWYYGRREQSLSESLEQAVRGGRDATSKRRI